MKHIGRSPYAMDDSLEKIYEETLLSEAIPNGLGKTNPLGNKNPLGNLGQKQQQPQVQQRQPVQQQQVAQQGQAQVQPQQVNPAEQLNTTFDEFVKSIQKLGYVQTSQDAQYWQQVKKYLASKVPNTTGQKQVQPSETTQPGGGDLVAKFQGLLNKSKGINS